MKPPSESTDDPADSHPGCRGSNCSAHDFVRNVGRYRVEASAQPTHDGYRGRADYSWLIDGYTFHGTKVFDDVLPSQEAACRCALGQFESLYVSGKLPL